MRHPIQKARVAALALLIVLSALAGCQNQGGVTRDQGASPSPSVQGSSARDAGAKLVVIHQDMSCDSMHVRLSRGARDRIQWHNQSTHPVSIVFQGAPVGEVVPPGEYSHPHRVNEFVGDGTWPYRPTKVPSPDAPVDTTGRPPADPDVSVGS